MKKVTMVFIAVASSITLYSQNLPKSLKQNWIAIVHNADSRKSFDSLLLMPDDDKSDTDKLFYIYWAYHGRNKFFWGYFDKSEPRSELVSGNYEKWKLCRDNILRVKNCKSKNKVYYKIEYYLGDLNQVKSISLIELSDRNTARGGKKQSIGYHK